MLDAAGGSMQRGDQDKAAEGDQTTRGTEASQPRDEAASEPNPWRNPGL